MTTVIEVPFEKNLAFYETTIVLSGQVYELKFRWTTRLPSWYLDIGTILQGVKIVNGIDLLAPYHYIDELPSGQLVAFRQSGTSSKPFFDNIGIGKAITLVYEI